MVDPCYVEHFCCAFNASDPPVKTCFLKIDPVIQRVAPELTRLGEIIRRTSCDADGLSLVVEPEYVRISPCIGTVHSNVDRHIAEELYAVVVCILLKLSPLLIEQELYEFPEHYIFIEVIQVVSDGIGVSVFDQMIGPFGPRLVVKQLFNCHIERIVREPTILIAHEIPVFLLIS